MPIMSDREYVTGTPLADERKTPRRGLWIAFLVFGWAVQAVIRWWLAREQSAPITSADEIGYLMAARVLSGGVGGDLSGGTFYQAGYSLLLTPIYWITRDPDQVFKIAVGLNSLIGALLFPLSYVGLRRFDVGRKAAYAAAFALAALPVGIWYGQLVWSDALLPVVIMGWLLALHSFMRKRTVSATLMCSILAGYASAVHSRGSVIVAVHFLTLLFVAWKSRAHRLLAFASMGVLGLVYVLGALLNRYIVSEIYPDGPRSLGDLLVQRMTSVDGLIRSGSGASGQIWYLGVSTWGLAAIGIAAAVAVIFMPSRPRQERLLAAVMIATTVGLAVASCAALPVEHRVGNYAYGRYLSFFAIPYSLAGMVVLVRAGIGKVFLAGVGGILLIAGGYFAVYSYAGDLLTTDQFYAADFPEMSFLTGDWNALHMRDASITGAALAGIATGLALFLRAPERWIGQAKSTAVGASVLAVAILAIDGAAAQAITVKGTREWNKYADTLSRPPVKSGEIVALDSRFTWEVPYQTMLRVWWTELPRFDPTTTAPPAEACAVLVKATTPPLKPAAGFHDAGHYYDRWVAWRRDSCGDEGLTIIRI
ncbi:hypothetical protein [Actinocorallia longicatena]|uniref:Glycosyltransferase RgtA/B/C/D-like domain-containing protein n=1 Tax=Actinocorallia longicatena TaxID=111803 RepID=A0ABP6QGX6_9ACTN